MATDTNTKTQGSDETIEVLYQRMGDRWFAFSCVGDDVWVGSISPEELAKDAKTARAPTGAAGRSQKLSGNS
jgi:hypothetical protein